MNGIIALLKTLRNLRLISWCIKSLKRIVPEAKETFRKPISWVIIVVIILMGFIIYQQIQIDELTRRLDATYDMSNSDSFDYRITNLEHISNAHAKRLNTIESDLWDANERISNHNWRIMQLEWLHPELKVAPPKTYETPNFTSKDFNNNPKHVPSPLQPGEPVWIPKN